MTNIAFIPLRGGSKSIPFKNVKPLMGKPLFYWCAKAASDSPLIDKVVLAIDHPEIKKAALALNMPKVEIYDRDPENARDDSKTIDVVLEYFSKNAGTQDDLFFLLQATSPLTTSEDIQGAYDALSHGKKSVLSCVRMHRFYWKDDGTPLCHDCFNRPRRQDFSGILMENGAIYLNSVRNILKDKALLTYPIALYEMPVYTSVEVDDPDDWIVIETLMKKYK